MRALWSQIPRPRVAGLPTNSPPTVDSIATILVRKTTTAPLRRRLTFNDAFTLLLTPVFATAFVVDTSWKEKQRREWEKKLAEIQNEIDQLHAKELRVRTSIRLRSVSNGSFHQRRTYATAAGEQATDSDDQVNEHVVEDEEDEEDNDNDIEPPPGNFDSAEEQQKNGQEHEHSSDSLAARNSATTDLQESHVYSSWETAAAHRYHRLIATMLAVRLLTHFHVSTTARFVFAEDEMIESGEAVTHFRENSKDVSWLVGLSTKMRKELRSLRRASFNLHGLGHQIDHEAEQGSLHRQLMALIHEFRKKKFGPLHFVQSYAELVLQSDQVPCTRTYVSMLHALGRSGHQGLAFYVSSALKSSTLPLTDNAVFYIILQFGKARDSLQMQNFLRRITQSGSPHNVVGRWELFQSNGIMVPVPTNLNTNILQAMVYMALRCQQTERAEAWFSLLRDTNFGNTPAKAHLFKSFLHHCALYQNWEAGKVWLRRCIHHAASIAALSMAEMGRLIFRMLDLCVACGRQPEYTMILDAAAQAGIKPPPVHTFQRKKKYTPRGRSILLEWETLMSEDTTQPRSHFEKVLQFQKGCDLTHLDPALTVKPSQQAPEDELVLMPPSAGGLRYSVVKRNMANSEVMLEQVSTMQGLFSRQQSEILALQSQIALARQSEAPRQALLDEANKGEMRQQKSIDQIQHQLDSLASDRRTIASLNERVTEMTGLQTPDPLNNAKQLEDSQTQDQSTVTFELQKQLRYSQSMLNRLHEEHRLRDEKQALLEEQIKKLAHLPAELEALKASSSQSTAGTKESVSNSAFSRYLTLADMEFGVRKPIAHPTLVRKFPARHPTFFRNPNTGVKEEVAMRANPDGTGDNIHAAYSRPPSDPDIEAHRAVDQLGIENNKGQHRPILHSRWRARAAQFELRPVSSPQDFPDADKRPDRGRYKQKLSPRRYVQRIKGHSELAAYRLDLSNVGHPIPMAFPEVSEPDVDDDDDHHTDEDHPPVIRNHYMR